MIETVRSSFQYRHRIRKVGRIILHDFNIKNGADGIFFTTLPALEIGFSFHISTTFASVKQLLFLISRFKRKTE